MAQLVDTLVAVALVCMMVSVGLGVSLGSFATVAKNGALMGRSLLVNYLVFPVVAVALLQLFQARPTVTAGFLILAVCPGAPFGPQFTAIAKGNVAVSVGLMAVLATTSVLLAPLMLRLLLPRLAGSQSLHIDTGKIIGTLLLTQLVPLAVGVALRQWRTNVAARLQKPFELATHIVGGLAVVLIVIAQRRLIAELKLRAVVGMLALWLATIVFGWLAGSSRDGSRTAVAQTTSLRNVGVALVIAASSFQGTEALPAVVAYALVSIVASLLVAIAWGRRKGAHSMPRTPARTAA